MEFIIKPMYTTTELRKLLHFKSNVGAKRFLQRLHVPCETTGQKDFWMLSEIKNHCPSLFDSIVESVGLNDMLSKKPSMEIDEEFYNELHFK